MNNRVDTSRSVQTNAHNVAAGHVLEALGARADDRGDEDVRVRSGEVGQVAPRTPAAGIYLSMAKDIEARRLH